MTWHVLFYINRIAGGYDAGLRSLALAHVFQNSKWHSGRIISSTVLLPFGIP
jgi:hypothetical protein